MNIGKRAFLVIWLSIAILPVITLWNYEIVRAYADYDGTCGLLDAGWTCTLTRTSNTHFSVHSFFLHLHFGPLVGFWPQ